VSDKTYELKQHEHYAYGISVCVMQGFDSLDKRKLINSSIPLGRFRLIITFIRKELVSPQHQHSIVNGHTASGVVGLFSSGTFGLSMKCLPFPTFTPSCCGIQPNYRTNHLE
jgi:hypothetical protein